MANDKTIKETIADSELSKWLSNEKADEAIALIESGHLTGEAALQFLAINAQADRVRHAAMERITDQEALKQIATHDASYFICVDAAVRLIDKSILLSYAQDEDPWMRREAIKRVADQKLLADAALWDYDEEVRAAAEARLTDEAALALLNERRAAHPDMAVDVFKQKENADIGGAVRDVHHSGPDSIFYWDSYLTDCNLDADIYCYFDGGSEIYPEEGVSAYLGADMDKPLWDFSDDAGTHDVAIDKRAKYAAVAASDGVYIVEAHPKKYRRYPGDKAYISPKDWPVLRSFENTNDMELAFDSDNLLHVRSAGQVLFHMVLDIDRRLAWDGGYVFYDAMQNPEANMARMERSPAPQLRWLFVHQTQDESALVRLLLEDKNEFVRRAAALRVTDRAALIKAAALDEDERVREAAKARIEALVKMKP